MRIQSHDAGSAGVSPAGSQTANSGPAGETPALPGPLSAGFVLRRSCVVFFVLNPRCFGILGR